MKIFLILLMFVFTSCKNAQNEVSSSQNSDYQLEIAFPNFNFQNPLDLQSAKDGSGRIFVVTQEGVIYAFNKNEENAELKTFLDIKNKVESGGEMGLLGLAFHPDFKNNKLFYVNYTADGPRRSIIAQYSVSSNDPNSADPNSEKILLTQEQPYSNHNAGQLAFGPDGFLYVGFGDGGSGGDPQNYAQNNKSFLGKMLRIDVNSASDGKSYGIPADNPFVNDQNYLPEIWATGLRNPWRYSFDPQTGRLWTGDVGQNKYEEIDIIEKGKNYGWRIMEGFHCFNPSSDCDTTGLTMPVWEYEHNDQGGYSITGGYVYRGANLPELQGKYIYADFVSGKIWALTYDGNSQAQNQLLIDAKKPISSFGVDDENELYICAFDGRIYKIKNNSATSVPRNNNDQGFKLYDNYPNPFNPSTAISYQLSNSGNVRLKVYDIFGKEIETLVDKIQSAGNYKVNFDGSDLASGIYFYQIQNEKNFISKKMVLVK